MKFRLDKCVPEVPESAYVHESAVLSGRVKLGEKVSVWPCAVLRGDIEDIIVGDASNVQDCAVLHANRNVPVILGHGVTVGHGAVVHGAKVGDTCLIGMKAVVLESEIGAESLIAAGSVLTAGKKIPPRSLVMGVPAKVVRQLSDEEVKALHESREDYLELAAAYRKGSERV